MAGGIVQNVARHVRLARVAAELGTSLMVFPELSLSGYEPDLARECVITPEDARLDPLREVADQGMVVVVGAPVAGEHGIRLGALALLPGGDTVIYTKQHLHPGEERFFEAGSGGDVLRIGDETVALAICADTGHAEHAAAAAARGATVYAAGVLITPAGYGADCAQLAGYAQEHRMAVLMANHGAASGGWDAAGKTCIWSEDGEPVAAADGTGEALVLATRCGRGWTGRLVTRM